MVARPVEHYTGSVLEAKRIYCAIHHDFTTLSNFQLCNSIDWKMFEKKCDIANHSNGLPFRYFGIFQLPNEANRISSRSKFKHAEESNRELMHMLRMSFPPS